MKSEYPKPPVIGFPVEPEEIEFDPRGTQQVWDRAHRMLLDAQQRDNESREREEFAKDLVRGAWFNWIASALVVITLVATLARMIP